jgi:flagellar assembly protein FliH
MAIIRANQLPAAARAFSMLDVEDAAKRVLLKAKLQAENLLAAAMDEAETLKEQARQEGSRAGFDQGHVEGVKHGAEAGRQQALQQHSAELSSLATSLTTIVGDLDARRQEIESQAVGEVVALAVAIARRVTKRQGLLDAGVLEANLSAAMKLAVGASDLRIAVHPDQRASLHDAMPRLKLEWPDLKHVELVDDPSLAPGGCRLFTRAGSIDADLCAQLDRIILELLPDATAAE